MEVVKFEGEVYLASIIKNYRHNEREKPFL